MGSKAGTRIRGLAIVRSGVTAPSLVMPGGSSRFGVLVAAGGRAGGESEGETSTNQPKEETTSDNAARGLRDEVMTVDFSRFGTWYEVDSVWEGHFMERTVSGAFKKTINDSQRGDGSFSTRSLFNHGFDMTIDNKALGVPNLLEERKDSPHMEVPLLDTSYVADLVPGLRNGAYGSSFMFEVIRDVWDHQPEESDDNPDGIPERTITEVRLMEAGPVTWPANPESTSGLRANCMTDGLMDVLHDRDPTRYDDLDNLYSAFRTAHRVTTRRNRAGTRKQKEGDAPSLSIPDSRHAERETTRSTASLIARRWRG